MDRGNRGRRSKGLQEPLAKPLPLAPDIVHEDQRAEDKVRVMTVVKRIPKPKELADRLGMDLQAVYTHRNRAWERLRSACSPAPPPPESRVSEILCPPPSRHSSATKSTNP